MEDIEIGSGFAGLLGEETRAQAQDEKGSSDKAWAQGTKWSRL
jgi:hypothetical protein